MLGNYVSTVHKKKNKQKCTYKEMISKNISDIFTNLKTLAMGYFCINLNTEPPLDTFIFIFPCTTIQ